MDWTSFAVGFCAGAITFDVLWRLTFVLTEKLKISQAEYIKELRRHLGLEP